jgi:CubicO group peptidase (beta-lactamase class C family)
MCRLDRRNPQSLTMAAINTEAINTLNPLQSKIRDLATAGLGKHAGMVVGILRGGDQWVAGYGSFDACSFDAAQQPPDEDAIFEIGSVTKVFTTLVLAEMVLRGEVALDDPAQKYLPSTLQMPKWRGQEITLFHLATHTSSLPRLPGNLLVDALLDRISQTHTSSLPPGNLWKTIKDHANPYANYQVSDMYEFLSGYKLKRPIGSRVEYSNLGMGLLGHILGLVAGKSYEELVGERILRPLGMNHTSIALSPQQQGQLAPGHTLGGKVTANWDFPALAGCGALRSTAGDVLRFVAASMNCATSPLAEAVRLCQRLYPKTRKALPSWWDYALALLFSGLGVFAQWHFGLAPRDPLVVLAVSGPVLFATSWLGLAPGLLATATTVAGTYFLQHGHHFNWRAGLVMVGLMLSGGFASRRPGLRNRNRRVVLGWQYQRLYQLDGVGSDARNVWVSMARQLFLPFKRGPRLVWHNGGTGGYRSFVGFIREREAAVVVLANSAKSVDSVGVEILRLLNRETSRNWGIARVSSGTQQGEGKQS